MTGAGGGLGAGICTSLAAAGATVACADIVTGSAERIARQVAERGGRSLALHVDVADGASVRGAVERTAAELGGIDVLVNNAAIYPRRAWTQITEEEWDRVLAVNLKGYFHCARACYRSMKERGGGHVINVSSITFMVGFEMLLDYVSSKGAIVGFTRALAHEVGPEGITVNAIAPGAFPTQTWRLYVYSFPSNSATRAFTSFAIQSRSSSRMTTRSPTPLAVPRARQHSTCRPGSN